VPTLRELSVSDDPEAWRAAGFTVDGIGQCVIGEVRVFLRPQQGRKGVIAWALDGAGDLQEVDGIPTTAPTLEAPTGRDGGEHANGATLIDHVVLATPDIARTQAALEAVGFEARRVREADSYGAPMKQVFFRAGEVILELIGPPEPAGDGPSGFFGIAVNVRDLDAAKSLLGEHLGDAKQAVQPGRRIATLRKTAGVTTAIAFMSEGSAEH